MNKKIFENLKFALMSILLIAWGFYIGVAYRALFQTWDGVSPLPPADLTWFSASHYDVTVAMTVILMIVPVAGFLADVTLDYLDEKRKKTNEN